MLEFRAFGMAGILWGRIFFGGTGNGGWSVSEALVFEEFPVKKSEEVSKTVRVSRVR